MMSPRLPDKIIINDSGLRAFWFIVKGLFKGIAQVLRGADEMAQEIEQNDWQYEPEAVAFLQEQEADCKAVDEACFALVDALYTFFKNQLDRNNRERIWIDQMLAKTRQKPTP